MLYGSSNSNLLGVRVHETDMVDSRAACMEGRGQQNAWSLGACAEDVVFFFLLDRPWDLILLCYQSATARSYALHVRNLCLDCDRDVTWRSHGVLPILLAALLSRNQSRRGTVLV